MNARTDDLTVADFTTLHEARLRGIQVVRQGLAWHFRGPGVDVVVDRPARLRRVDLRGDVLRDFAIDGL